MEIKITVPDAKKKFNERWPVPAPIKTEKLIFKQKSHQKSLSVFISQQKKFRQHSNIAEQYGKAYHSTRKAQKKLTLP